MILGLDLSSVGTGYAILDNELLAGYGCVTPKKTLSSQDKLLFLYENITSLLENYNITSVAIEDQFSGPNAETFKVLVRISGIAILSAKIHGMDAVLYKPNTVKRIFAGYGLAKKGDMLKRANELFGLDISNDNIADAIGVAYTHKQLNI